MDRRLIGLPLLAALCWGCVSESEATATATVEEGDRVGTSTVTAEFLSRARAVLHDADEPRAGWAVGVVVSENADGSGSDWVVLLPGGEQTLLSTAYNCVDDGDSILEKDLWQLLDPGDLLEWSEEGDDTLVCTGEVDVEWKNAVEQFIPEEAR